jgi:hypothetical protein
MEIAVAREPADKHHDPRRDIAVPNNARIVGRSPSIAIAPAVAINRPRSSGERIEKRKVTGSITALEKDEVREMEHRGTSDEQELDPSDRRLLQPHHGTRQRRVDHCRARREQPNELGSASGSLREEIPCGMGDGGRQDESESACGHRAPFSPTTSQEMRSRLVQGF